MPSPGISDPVNFSKPIDTSQLKDKTALVTGGASGIGAGIVSELAQAGAYVTILDLNNEAGEKYAGDLTAKGLKYVGYRDVLGLMKLIVASPSPSKMLIEQVLRYDM